MDRLLTHQMPPLGVEPSCPVLQTGAMTPLAQTALGIDYLPVNQGIWFAYHTLLWYPPQALYTMRDGIEPPTRKLTAYRSNR